MDCQLSLINNHTNGFDFGEFIPVYKYLNETCLPDSEIFFQGTRLLTDSTCHKIVGSKSGTFSSLWTEWTPYPIVSGIPDTESSEGAIVGRKIIL